MEMLTFQFDLDGSIPLYQQLYEYVKKEIQSGRIMSGAKLPSKRKLSSYLGISQNTVQAAYEQLIDEGYINPVERKGFFVCQLDDIIQLKPATEDVTLKKKENNEEILYDFSYQGVDMQTFPFSTWRKLSKEAMHEYDVELLRLGDYQGHLDLRMSIASYLRQSRGVNCNADQIIISAGTEFLIQMLVQLFPHDVVYGIENPGYERLNLLFNSNRANYRSVNIDTEGIVLEDIIKKEVDIICITPSHQFPSGSIMPINRRIQILNWAKEDDRRFIIDDDYDSEFKYSGRPIPALQGLDDQGRVIYMGAFSKSLTPAIRVSYMVLPDKLMDKFRKKLSFVVCPVPTLEQKVLHRFIQDGYFERHLNKMRNVYRKKREILLKTLLPYKDNVKISGADAGLHLLLHVKNGMSEEDLVIAAKEAGIKVYGISRYYFEPEMSVMTPTILIGYATIPEDSIPAAANLLIQSWYKREHNVC